MLSLKACTPVLAEVWCKGLMEVRMSMQSKNIIILGTGGNCIDILDTILDINDSHGSPVYTCRGFLDDDDKKWGMALHGVNVLGPLSSAQDYPDSYFVNGIGSPTNFWRKQAIIAKTCLPIGRFETIIHPTASVSRLSQIGRGVVIFQHVTVTSNVRLGNHVILLPNTIISHDDVIGHYTCIAGGVCISGGVEIGRSCYLGTNASVIGNIKIGDNCMVGMGSVVLHDIAENMVVAGNPARVLRRMVEA
jgi:sugar O-acyltransferase (sialic acid O-acetyltransferase NeuD family)